MMEDENKNKQSAFRENFEKRAGILEERLSGRIGESNLSWGMVVLALGAVWAAYELVRSLVYFF